MAKYLLFAVLALPLAELAVFILVAAQIGFGWALLLVLATSAIGVLVLRRAGGSHIERAKVALGAQRVSALQADASGVLILLAGFLLALPGFITDVIGLILLIRPLRRLLGGRALRAAERQAERRTGVVDLEPEEWRQVGDPRLDDDRTPR